MTSIIEQMKEPMQQYNNAWCNLEAALQEELKQTGSVINEGELVRYRNIVHEGYLGDFATEWWTQEDWDKHNKRVEQLKADGTYGKPWICDLLLKPHPEFDAPIHPVSSKPMESYRIELIDFSK